MRARSLLWLWIIPLLLLITVLAITHIHSPFWLDEIWSLYYAGGAQYGPIPLAETVQRTVEQYMHERNPPGYYLMLNLWGAAVGWSGLAGRMLSLFAGLLSVALVYRLGRDLVSSRMGMGAAVMLGMSAFFVYYLHELRVYTIYALFTTLIIWLYWQMVNRENLGIALQTLYVLTIVGLLYTYYLNALILVALGLYHLLFARKSRHWWRLILLTIIGGLFFLPQIGLLLDATERASEVVAVAALDAPTIVATIAAEFSNYSVALLGFLLLCGLTLRLRSARLIWVLTILVLALGLALNAVFPVIMHIRYLILLWPLFALICSLGLVRLASLDRRLFVVVCCIWIGAGIWNTLYAHQDTTLPYPTLAESLKAHAQPDDLVVFHASQYDWLTDLEFKHYMDGLPFRNSLLERIPGKQDDGDYYSQALQFIGDAPSLWLGVDKRYPPTFRLSDFQNALNRNYDSCDTEFDLPDMRLELYARRVTTGQFQFGSGIRFSLLAPVQIEADQSLRVLQGWLVGGNVPASAYSVAIHIENADGQLVAQADYGLPVERHACHLSHIPINNLPPGEYTMRVIVYHWDTGRRVIAKNAATGELGERLQVATFYINP
jgi:Dolichyl-phosphate-mannose-protein mannosyltransferase